MTLMNWTDLTRSTRSGEIGAVARRYLGGRRGLLVLATAIVASGAALNWQWLVAVGAAPLILGVLPCVAMCALGLCMNRMGGRSCSSEPAVRAPSQPPVDGSEPLASAPSSHPDEASRQTVEPTAPRRE